ncbi:MAG: SDR family NAD(P)-dependent oxidoreductase [Gulosibacter sp.]|uniref:SDR family NAD(P)-dependent oxidoreductase n=1 Tax=Gulosibacter sp. TaxID=2817531 RepID=UPI003F931F57
MRLANKIVIVTGGSQGIGRATVELFAEQGATVYMVDVKAPTDSFSNPNIHFVEHDVTDLDKWQRIVDGVISEQGRVDVLLNNAGGVGSYEPIHSIGLDDWNRIIDLNLNGTFYGIRTVLPHMIQAGQGNIVNVSSMWGIVGAAGVAAYTASKGAVRLMSKNVALSYADKGIRCNSLHPGIISTPMIEAQDTEITAGIVASTPMKRLGRPRELAYGALFLASDESSYMTGSELVIDGGFITA